MIIRINSLYLNILQAEQVCNSLINLDCRHQSSSDGTNSHADAYFNTEYLFEEVQASLGVKGEAAVFWGGLRMGNSIC